MSDWTETAILCIMGGLVGVILHYGIQVWAELKVNSPRELAKSEEQLEREHLRRLFQIKIMWWVTMALTLFVVARGAWRGEWLMVAIASVVGALWALPPSNPFLKESK